MVREHGSFGQVVRDAVEGFDPFGVKDWVLDHTVGEDVDAERPARARLDVRQRRRARQRARPRRSAT